jgi:DNA-directed RNA polymerase beta' subunit
MGQKRHLTSEEIEFMVDFILPRPHLPPHTEASIVSKKRAGIINQLVGIEIYEALIPDLKKEIERQYIDSIIPPGECVGIIGAQSMGEYSTQATLNTFHVAGVDTGSSTGVSRFQDLINASKTIKTDTLSLFFKTALVQKPSSKPSKKKSEHGVDQQPTKLSDLRSIVASKLIDVKLSHLVTESVILNLDAPSEKLGKEKLSIDGLIEDSAVVAHRPSICSVLSAKKGGDIEKRNEIEELKDYKKDIEMCISLYDSGFDYKTSTTCFKIVLSKQILLKHRLHPSRIKTAIEDYIDCKCAFVSFASCTGNGSNGSGGVGEEREGEGGIVFFIFFFSALAPESEKPDFDNISEETVLQQLMDVKICGVDGVVRYDFKKILDSVGSGSIHPKDHRDEWYIETRGGTFNDINCLSDIFDLTKTKTTSVWDVYNTFGIEATKQFLVQELKSVMDGVDICHIKLLVERMTYSGTIEPITRYTMRSDESPLSRASFEESFETFMKAAKYKEVEPFDGVSAAVMGGKKAEVGTYMCDIFMDIERLVQGGKCFDVTEDIIYEDDEDLVYVD